jgi:mannose-1-phosphate guanylyltransferase/mannose-1-phosphate guanylyltransferase/mannose-6-phosphate isomerase
MTDATVFLQYYEKDERPWGNFRRFMHDERTTTKVITVDPGQALSLQSHRFRDEFWFVIAGSGTFHVDGRDFEVCQGHSVYIPRSAKHRATAGAEGLVFLEIAFGDSHETDIIRYEDKYGRA